MEDEVVVGINLAGIQWREYGETFSKAKKKLLETLEKDTEVDKDLLKRAKELLEVK